MLDYNMRVRYLFIMFAAQQLRVYTIYMHERKPELDRVRARKMGKKTSMWSECPDYI